MVTVYLIFVFYYLFFIYQYFLAKNNIYVVFGK